MLKRFMLIVTTIIISAGLLVPVFAAPPANDASGETKKPTVNIQELISEKSTVETEQTLVEFTKPDKAENSTYKKTYTFSGSIDKSDIHVCLARYNKETGKYELYKDVDGESDWVGLHGFIKVFELNPGENKIKVIAYNDKKADSLALEDIQVNYFTINYLKESDLEKAFNNFITNIKGIFTPSR